MAQQEQISELKIIFKPRWLSKLVQGCIVVQFSYKIHCHINNNVFNFLQKMTVRTHSKEILKLTFKREIVFYFCPLKCSEIIYVYTL